MTTRKADQANLGANVAPVARDGFLYNGKDFLFDYDGHHVERCDSDTLYQLLTDGSEADRCGWFYSAQLHHYGLKPLKTKSAAKNALLAAIRASPTHKLQVPADILKLEEALKAEYAGIASNDDDGSDRSHKRAKKDVSPQQQLIIDLQALPEAQRTDILVDLVTKLPIAEGFLKARMLSVTGQGNSCLSSSKSVAGLAYIGHYTVTIPEIANGWDLDCGGGRTYDLALATSKSGHLWGKFEFGVYAGTIRSKGSVPASLGNAIVEFTWHGRETGEQEIQTEDEQDGTLEFDADARNFKGVFNSPMDVYEMAGTFKESKRTRNPAYAVRDWKKEYRETGWATWESEIEARHSGSMWAEVIKERPEDSDTDGRN